jgi:ATP adenylyltransferase/5',5'''-P-1,P-4-tetraphosphate phosphorylase II
MSGTLYNIFVPFVVKKQPICNGSKMFLPTINVIESK